MLEKKLNEFNIFALRDLARKSGVSSPTSKKKEVLIAEIVQIMSGKQQPKEQSKQGRPPKMFDYNFEHVISFSKDEKSLNEKVLKQEALLYENAQLLTVVGWLELVSNGFALLWVQNNFKNENYLVPSSFVKEYNLKMGDKIVAEVGIEESQKVVKEIFNINDCPITKFSNKRKYYEEISHCADLTKLKFNNQLFNSFEIMQGENCYFYGINNNQNTIKLIEMLQDCEIENKVYINISIAEKNKIYLESLKGVECFVSMITEDVNSVRRMILIAVERIKRILENCENVLIVVDDVASILGNDSSELNLVKNLISLPKKSKRGSITMLNIIPNENFYQIEKLADKRFVVSNSQIQLKI